MNNRCPRKTIQSIKSINVDNSADYIPHRNWNIRNNSSNVCSLLTSCSTCEEDLEQTPRKITLLSKTQKPQELPHNTYKHCYCTMKPIKPKLFCNTNGHINATKRDTCYQFEKPLTCNLNSICLKHMQKPQVLDSLGSTNLDDLLITNEVVNEIVEPPTTSDMCDSESKHDVSATGQADLAELKTFRDENYFDCHSHTNLTKRGESANHRCVHRFTLNERLRPVPENADQFGISRCAVCDRAMTAQRGGSGNESELSANSLNRATRAMLRPDKIVLSEDETMEVNVPEKIMRETESLHKLMAANNKFVPTNSCALRHQKGVY